MEECEDDSSMLEREGEARRQRFFHEGYRESIEDGKSRLMQAGFDVGFAAGADAGVAWGRMLAIEKTLRNYASIGSVSTGANVKDCALELTSLLGKVDPRQAMLTAMKEILSRVPDGAAIQEAALEQAPEEEPVTDKELCIASELLPQLVEEGNKERAAANTVDLKGLEQAVVGIRESLLPQID